MNFDEWYSQTWGSDPEYTDESNKAFCAWQACKQEMLKLLNSGTIKFGEEETLDDYLEKLKEEINKRL